MSNLVEKTSTVTTTAIFNKSGTERFLLKMEWDHRKKSVLMLMKFPALADEILIDQTSLLCRNGAVKNDFGSLSIVNLTSSLFGDNPKTSKQNRDIILEECEKADCILVCFGRGTDYQDEKAAMMGDLLKYKKKLFTLTDSHNKQLSHPLSPLCHSFTIEPLKLD